MQERQPWEIPPYMTVEEIADLTGLSVRAVKHRRTRKGWAYGVGPDGMTYIDLRTVDCGNMIFDCIVEHDRVAYPLRDIVVQENLDFLDMLLRVNWNRAYELYYLPAALLCRSLEILQAAQRNLSHVHLPSASVGLSLCIGMDRDILWDMMEGKIFPRPILETPRRFWLTLLMEYLRGVDAEAKEVAALAAKKNRKRKSGRVASSSGVVLQ